jgi:hypothetical protein
MSLGRKVHGATVQSFELGPKEQKPGCGTPSRFSQFAGRMMPWVAEAQRHILRPSAGFMLAIAGHVSHQMVGVPLRRPVGISDGSPQLFRSGESNHHMLPVDISCLGRFQAPLAPVSSVLELPQILPAALLS